MVAHKDGPSDTAVAEDASPEVAEYRAQSASFRKREDAFATMSGIPLDDLYTDGQVGPQIGPQTGSPYGPMVAREIIDSSQPIRHFAAHHAYVPAARPVGTNQK